MEPPDFIDIAGPDPTGGLREMRNLSMALQTLIAELCPPYAVEKPADLAVDLAVVQRLDQAGQLVGMGITHSSTFP